MDNSVLFYFSCGRWAAAVLTQRQEGSSCGLLLVDFERDLMMYALTGKMKLVWYGRLPDGSGCSFDCFGCSEEMLNAELVGN